MVYSLIQVDDLTVLFQVEYDEVESRVLHQYTLVDTALDKDQLAPLAARVLEASCSDETMTDFWLFKADISIVHEYFDSSGYKAIIRLSTEFCSNMLPYVSLEKLN